MANILSSFPTIVFWNCRGLRRHLTNSTVQLLLHRSFTSKPPSIIVFTETHWSDAAAHGRPASTKLPSVSGYNWAHRHHTATSGGLAILYHQSIACMPMTTLNAHCNPISLAPNSPSAVFWLTVRFSHTPPFLLGAGYIRPMDHESVNGGSQAAKAMCAAFLTAKAATNLPVLLTGDFNLRHPDWQDWPIVNPTTPITAATDFATAIESANLTVLNSVLMPGIVTRPAPPGHPGPGSVIDLAITDSPLLVLAMDIEHADTLDSDHYPITLTMDLKPQQPPQPSNSRPRKQWSVHRRVKEWQAALPLVMQSAFSTWPPSLLTQPLPAHPALAAATAQSTIDTVYSSLESTFLTAVEDAVGSHKSSNRSKHWFTLPGVRAAYHHMKATRRVWRHSRKHNPIKHQAAMLALQQWKQVVKEAKDKSWSDLCSAIQTDPKSQLRWTMFKRSRGRDSSSLSSFPDPQGNTPAHLEQSLDNLCSAFVSSSIPPPLPVNSPELDIDTRYLLPRLRTSSLSNSAKLASHCSDSWMFSPAEVEEQCRHQHTNSAPGNDTILPILLKHAGPAAYDALSTIFNYSWQHAVLPQQWTEANVMALWKGKGDRSDPSSFRPISMTSIIIRTFEHLIHSRLSTLLEAKSFFHPLQFGFRKRHSTLDALNCFQSNTRAMFPTSHQTDCPTLFLDLQKAFDRVWHPKLLQCVEQAGITGRAWSWIAAFLSRRRIRTVDRNQCSAWFTMEFGVPQGAVLSPLLFNIFINPVARRIARWCPRLQCILYADDMAVQPKVYPLVNGVRKPPGASRLARTSFYNSVLVHLFRILNEWCAETRMLFGKAKTQWVVFDKRQRAFDPTNYPELKQYRLCGFTPEVVEEYKYLGVTHHRHLTWETQTYQSINRIRTDCHMLCRVIRPPAAPHFSAVRALCVGYIRPRCTYASAFWQPKAKEVRKMQAAFLHPLQRVLGLPNSSHHLGLLAEAHCPSFEALRTQAAVRFLLRAEALSVSHPQHPTGRILAADRAAAARGHCRGHTTSSIPTCIYAEQTALPHLINKVLARLPELAPGHPLLHTYFPAALQGAPALPVTLSVEEVNSLTMVDTHREWRDPPTLSTVQQSTAPLLTIKRSPSLSLFLRHESNPMVAVRARIRANRVPTQYRRYHLRPPTIADPTCTHPACRMSFPHYLDTIDHILLQCDRHRMARQQLIQALAMQHQYHIPLTVAFISGEVTHQPSPRGAQLIRARSMLDLTANFLNQVMQDRATADSSLHPFHRLGY